MNEVNELLELEQKLNTRDDKKYKLKAIYNSKVFVKEAVEQLPWLYYLVSWKSYLEKKSTWKSPLAVIHLCKMINTFHKDYPKKSIVRLALIDFNLPIAKLTAKLSIEISKRKQDQPIKSFVKWIKKVWIFHPLIRLQSYSVY